MKKTITLLTLILASFSINASDGIDNAWDDTGTSWVNEGDYSASYGTGEKYKYFVASIVYNEQVNDIMFGLYLVPPSNLIDFSDCKGNKKKQIKFLKNNIWYVEGQGIKMKSYCYGEMEVDEPATKSGNDFIINKFKKKHNVQIGSVFWNANGFTEQYNRLIRTLKAL